MISLKHLFSISLFSLGLLLIANTAEAVCPERVRCPSKSELLYRSVAAEQSANLINNFTSQFGAAVRETDPVLQATLVQALLPLLTTPFSITYGSNPPIVNGTELLAAVTALSSDFNFFADLVENLSITNHSRNALGQRTLQIQTLDLVATTTSPFDSTFFVNSKSFTVVETSCDLFQIQSIVITPLSDVSACCETG